MCLGFLFGQSRTLGLNIEHAPSSDLDTSMALKLNLSFQTYLIQNDGLENGHVSSLTGSVAIPTCSHPLLADATEIHVSLVQSIRCENSRQDIPQKSISNPASILCLPFRSPKFGSYSRKHENKQIIRDVLLRLSSTTDQKKGIEMPFALDIPPNIPATTSTSLGEIEYTLQATAINSQHGTITDCQPLRITRHTIQRDLKKTRLPMYFPNSASIHRVILSQNPTPRSGPRFSFTANISHRWETAPGDRPEELKHFVVREIKWVAEETVKIMAKPRANADENYSVCEQAVTRKLGEGSTKGYWGFDRNPFVKHSHQYLIEDQNGKLEMRIPFNFAISTKKMVHDDIDINGYEFADYARAGYSLNPSDASMSSSKDLARVLTVDHQLRVEILTSQDVFNQSSGTLVERRQPRVTLCPVFPFSVCEVST